MTNTTVWWAHQDSNLGRTGYEPVALTAELWALLVLRTPFPDHAGRLFHEVPFDGSTVILWYRIK